MARAQPRQTVFADSGNRTAAFLLDLLLLSIVASSISALELQGRYLSPLLVFLYFAGMPLTPLQGTLGKWIFRIKLCDRQGRRLTWRASALRVGATLCWFGLPLLFGTLGPFGSMDGTSLLAIWWLLFALPWAPAGFLPRRESLFDLLAGSLVVRCRADTASIAAAEPAQQPGIRNTLGTVLSCLVTGAMLSVMMQTQRDMELRSRIAYAMEQTASLRERIAAFHDSERRWPTAEDLGVPEWTPYYDGGGYRLGTDGNVVITFSVLRELKGRSIVFRPLPAADGKGIRWQCSADAGIKPRHVAANCR
jgi:uncharacterized RDD family membrane protein YckC